jgi:MFS transporter, OFA family, oxalate/formate antiporter
MLQSCNTLTVRPALTDRQVYPVSISLVLVFSVTGVLSVGHQGSSDIRSLIALRHGFNIFERHFLSTFYKSKKMSNTVSTSQINQPTGLLNNRWFYLILAVLLMCMISGVQYAWTLFSRPMTEKLAVSLAAVQTAFTLSQVIQSVSQPGGGFFVDKFGPKFPGIVGGLMVLIGWGFMGQVDSVPALYALYTLAGAGIGIIYGIAMNTANRWFPDKRGLASGFTAAGYGLGVLPFLPLISGMLKEGGVGPAFMWTGGIMGIVIIIVSCLIKFPAGQRAGAKKVVTEKDFKSSEMLRTPHFWVLWFSFFSVNFGFLLLVANSAPFGRTIGIAGSMMALVVMFQNLANGGCRPFWGFLSDKIGRYKAMTVMFGVNALAMFAFTSVAQLGTVFFVAILMLAFFTSGGSYALFPPTNSDLFGTAYSAQNYGFFWAAKAVASIFGGGLGAAVATEFGWTTAFTLCGCMSLISFTLATFVVPRMGRPKRPAAAIAALQAAAAAEVK